MRRQLLILRSSASNEFRWRKYTLASQPNEFHNQTIEYALRSAADDAVARDEFERAIRAQTILGYYHLRARGLEEANAAADLALALAQKSPGKWAPAVGEAWHLRGRIFSTERSIQAGAHLREAQRLFETVGSRTLINEVRRDLEKLAE